MTTVDRDEVVAALDEEWDALAALAGELQPDDWGRDTACPGWTVKDHYSHIAGLEALLLGREAPAVTLPDHLPHVRNDMGRANEVWIEHYRSRGVPDLLADLGEVVVSRRAALAGMDQSRFDEPSWTPAGEDTYGRFMRIRVMDQWFHEQDVREATGRPGHLEGRAPDAALTEVTAALGYVVGKKAGVPAGRSVRFELTGPVARRVDVEVGERARVVDALRGTPTVTLTLPGERFLRIAGGRLRGADPLDDAVGIEGDRALGETVVRELPFMI
ncbi:MAG TPA: maleylpyruvate isomerase family mycothiol-dependent enzyme [Acidimicrobiales bacterium]